MDNKAASWCGCSMGSWLPAAFYPSSLLEPCLQGTSRRVPVPIDQSLLFLSPGEKEHKEEDERMEFMTPKSSRAKAATAAAAEEETVSTSAQSSAVDTEAVAESNPSPDRSAEGKHCQHAEIVAKQPEVENATEEVMLQVPNFAGTWDLVRTEGDLDRLLSDMGQGWLIRNGAKALKYGIGRVVVECQQDGDDLRFSKVLCDPRNLSKSHVHITVGQGAVRFLDDIGRLSSTSRWDGSSLCFDAKLESSGLSVTLLMYYNNEGNFVEEMISCKGTVAKYIFNRRA